MNKYQFRDIQTRIWNSVSRLDLNQQVKLLDFINSLVINKEKKNQSITKYAGNIEKDELEVMKKAIIDCEKIDYNEW